MITIERTGIASKEQICEMVSLLLRELEGDDQEFAGINIDKVYRDMSACGDRFNAFLAKTGSGEAIGILTLYESFAIYAGGNYGIIDEMYVVPQYRSRNIGKQLLEAAIDFGRERNWLRIDVTAPPEENWKRTVAFYEKAGFVFTGPKLRLTL